VSKTLVVAAGKLSTPWRQAVETAGSPWWYWKPLLATGVVVAGAGVAFHALSARNFSDFDTRFRNLPCAATGCMDTDVAGSGLSDQLVHARREQQIAVGKLHCWRLFDRRAVVSCT